MTPLQWANAQQTTIIADADIMERDSVNKTLLLKGNVNVIFQQQHLLCDEAFIDEKEKTITARGNVVMENAKTTLRAEKVVLNYQTNSGRIYNGLITSGQVLIEAETIEKVGEDEYIADQAYYTACLTCPPSWGFTSSKVHAEIGGYAYISRPWLYLLQFPVLPLPYLIVPLNSRRQTGFLVPQPSSNNQGGLAIEQPFFWAIDRSQDATFSLVNYEKRGVQGKANYRYMLNETSGGELNTAYMKDRIFGYQDRWFLNYKHQYDLPNNFTQRTEIALTSDRRYPLDFPDQLLYLGQAALDNRNSLSKGFEESLLTIDSSYYVSLIEKELNLDNPDSLHRMPEINFHLMDQKIHHDSNLYFNMNIQYLNVSRQGPGYENAAMGTNCYNNSELCFQSTTTSNGFQYGAPTGTTNLGPQDYGDLIRTGQRLDLKPTLHAPFWVGSILDVDPSLSLRYTQYSLGVDSDPTQGYDAFPHRFYSQLGLSTKTYLSQVYDWNDNSRLKHTLIPEIDIKYIPQIHQSQHHFFGTQQHLRYFRELQPIDDTDADWRNGGRGIQFDANDRVIGTQLINFALTNKILSRSLQSQSGESAISSPYKQNFYLRVSQALDLKEASRGDDARPWQDIVTEAVIQTGSWTQSLGTSYFPYHNRTLWRATSRYNFFGRNYVMFGYYKNYLIGLMPPVDDNSRNENLLLSTGLNFKYLYFYGMMEYDLNPRKDLGREKFKQWSVIARITPPGSCWSIYGAVSQVMDTPRLNHSINMEFIFGE